jgi:hypothetical protein
LDETATFIFRVEVNHLGKHYVICGIQCWDEALSDSLEVHGCEKEISYTKWGKEDRNVKEEVHEKKGEGGVRGRNARGKAGPENLQLQRVSAFNVLLSCTLARALKFHIQRPHAVDTGKNSNTEAQ